MCGGDAAAVGCAVGVTDGFGWGWDCARGRLWTLVCLQWWWMGLGGVGWEALWAVMFADDIVFCGEGGERVEAGELGLCFGERGSGGR